MRLVLSRPQHFADAQHVLGGLHIHAVGLAETLRVAILGEFQYFGGGIGAAFIQNAGTNLALTATAGLRWAMTDQAYMGLRYRFTRVEGPTDEIGLKYEPIMSHSVMAMLGVYLD